MDWKKTTIKLTLNNEKYKKGVLVRTFNNIIPDPTEEQIKELTEGILLLSDDNTTVTKTEVLTRKDAK